jgi:hypothetical protein
MRRFFTRDRDSVSCDFKDIRRLFVSVFAVVDTRGFTNGPSKRRVDRLLVSIRYASLE